MNCENQLRIIRKFWDSSSTWRQPKMVKMEVETAITTVDVHYWLRTNLVQLCSLLIMTLINLSKPGNYNSDQNFCLKFTVPKLCKSPNLLHDFLNIWYKQDVQKLFTCETKIRDNNNLFLMRYVYNNSLSKLNIPVSWELTECR